jgi:hypothetical protein
MTSHPVVFDGKHSKLVIVNDVTERKLLDEKQQRLHTSLQQSAMEWRQTFNAIDFPVLIIDLHGVVKRSNEAPNKSRAWIPNRSLDRGLNEIADHEPWKKAAELIERSKKQQLSSLEEIKCNVTGKTWALTLYLINEFGSVGRAGYFHRSRHY